MKKENYLDRTFANLTWDAGFKAAFRDPNRKEALKLLLNTFLPLERKVQELTFTDREQNGLSVKNKTNLFDIHCKDQYGRDFIVEMQRRDFAKYLDRCFAYGASSYSANVDRGDSEYGSAVPVYMMSFLATVSRDPRINNSSKLVKRCWFIDDEGQSFENQFINLIFVRLYEVKNLKEPDKDTPPIDRCCWLMTHLSDMDKEPGKEVVGDFGPIVEAAKIAGFDKEKKRKYITNMDREHLERAIRHQCRIDGIAEGEAMGRVEGRAEERADVVGKLLKAGMTLESIADALGIPLEECAKYSEKA